MEINLTTPSLLFPAITLLLLAYTNRFVVLANLIRSLSEQYQENKEDYILLQISNLRKRVYLIRNMQAFGIASLLICVICMFLLFAGKIMAGQVLFGISLVLLMLSLAMSLWEIQISVKALEFHLERISKKARQGRSE